MDIIFFVQSVNRIAITAFFITFIFIVVEIYLLVKQQKKQSKPFIPEFKRDRKYSSSIQAFRLPPQESKSPIIKKPNKRLLLILIIILIFFGTVYLLGIILRDNSKQSISKNAVATGQTVKIVSSAGIKLFNDQWVEIPQSKAGGLKPGEKIFIGISTIAGERIDKARIRVNQNIWLPKDETTLFEKKAKVYYKEYTIASEESQLVIEAQLYSVENGWLGQ